MSSRFRFEDEGQQGPIGPIGPIGPAGPTPMDPSGNLDLSCNNLLDVSGIYFCNSTSITTFGDCITISGCLDMSCNSIVDVSQVDFCKDIVLTKPGDSGGIAIGYLAGYIPGVSSSSISIGDSAGNGALRSYSIAIGQDAGNSGQSAETIAIGHSAGETNQGASAIAVGQLAGGSSQGANSIAIGNKAGSLSQPTNSIILNATNIALNTITAKTFHVKPIREDPSKNILYYNDVTGEITYSAKHSHGLDLSCSDITDVSNIFFCNDTCISGNVQNVLSISGDFGVTTKDGVGNLKVTDTDLVSVAAGTDAIPAINFSVAGSSSTGMYRPAADAVGFSTGGAEKVRISPPGIYYPVGGLSVGTAGNIAGIRRLSAISANSWEDGHLGNSKALIFTPSDMVIGSASARAIQTQSLQPDPARPGAAYYGTTTITGDGTICCQKVIPKGFQIGRYPGGGASTIRIYTPNGQLNSGTCYVSAQKWIHSR